MNDDCSRRPTSKSSVCRFQQVDKISIKPPEAGLARASRNKNKTEGVKVHFAKPLAKPLPRLIHLHPRLRPGNTVESHTEHAYYEVKYT